MEKQNLLANYSKELEALTQEMSKLFTKYNEAKEKIVKVDQELKKDIKNIKVRQDLSKKAKEQELKNATEATEQKKKKLDEEVKAIQTSYNDRKKYAEELATNMTELNKKQHAEEMLKVEGNKELGEQEAENRRKIQDEIVRDYKKFQEAIKKDDTTINKDEYKKKEKEEEDKARKTLFLTGESWKKLSETIKTSRETAGEALKSMFGATTKFIDQEIANAKKEIQDIDKELAKLNTDFGLQLSQAKEAAISEAVEGGEDKGTATTEIAELERLYDLQQQMAEVNEERRIAANGAAYEEMKFSEEQQKNFDALSIKHASYAQALEDKTQNEQAEQSRYNQLTKQKQKLEEDIRKKELRKKKVEASNQIISATINIAEGVTKALAGPFPMNIVNAAIVGAAGLAQLGVMIANATKIKAEDGGLLSGRRHAQGGMRIEGTNIEVEGGEYVINRQSTAKNLSLLKYINGERRELDSDDLYSFFSAPTPRFQHPQYAHMLESGGQVPTLPMSTTTDTQQILDAISSVNFQPRVAVTDIHHVQQQMTQVDEWVGM